MVDPTAVTALFVSLIALLATVGQLLQQYFATADGYRRCQPSVMGLWARKTKLRWRWSEFRFETVFIIPRIVYGPFYSDAGTKAQVKRKGKCSLTDTPESLEATMTFGGWDFPDARRYYDSDELVCWIPLLAQLHKQGGNIVRRFPHSDDLAIPTLATAKTLTDNDSLPATVKDTWLPVVQFVKRSWDFMPTDVVRPVASTTVSDVGIMARRLGMIWKTFDPSSGSMRAEGNGHVITSTTARSLGTILQYIYTSRKILQPCYYIPVRQADMLGFGLVQPHAGLFFSKNPSGLDVSSYSGFRSTIHTIGLPHRPSRSHLDSVYLADAMSRTEAAMKNGMFVPGLNDLVPLCSSMLAIKVDKSDWTSGQTWERRVPAPNTLLKGPTASQEGYLVYREMLQKWTSNSEINSASVQSSRILEIIESLDARFLGWFEDNYWTGRDGEGLDQLQGECLDAILEAHEEMTVYLLDSKVLYGDIVGEHFLLAATKEYGPTATPIMEAEGMASVMLLYFERLPWLIHRVREWLPNGLIEDHDIQDTWFSMIFRAFCWQRCHVMIEGVPPLPSEYWGSKMPVYIG